MQSTFLAIGLLASALWLVLLFGLKAAIVPAWDERILQRINRRFAPGKTRAALKVERAMRDLTALGGDMVMALLLLAGSLLVFARVGTDAALLFAGLLVTARIFGFAVKVLVRRERPQLAGQTLRAFTSSFPSVHTLMTLVGAFAVLSACGITFLPALVWAGGMAALVGITRLYFAVHWPSDVLAGWLAGLSICAFAAALVGA